MKKQIPTFIAGMLTMALVGGLTVTALAASGNVLFNSVNIRVNGQQVSAKGENFVIGNGQSVPGSILYEDATGGGTTYVPLARLAELLDTPIGWDGSTGSVLIGEEPPAPISTDYSTWTAEQEAAYQEFKVMWDIQPVDKYIEASVFTTIPSEQFVQFIKENDSFIKEIANRFIVDLFNEYHVLNNEGEFFVSFNTYGGSAWGGLYNPNKGRVSNSYKLENVLRQINRNN